MNDYNFLYLFKTFSISVMSKSIAFTEEEEKPEIPNQKQPPLTKPLATLHKDTKPNINDTEMDVLLPYFIEKKEEKEARRRS